MTLAPHTPDLADTDRGPRRSLDLVVVGGVPGAGKSTLIKAVQNAPGAIGLDPDNLREPIATKWPGVPYRAYRWAVHTVFTVLVWLLVLMGPRLGTAMLGDAEDHVPGVVLIHDTATRPRRRRLLLTTASRRGWDTTLLLVDATRDEAIEGQVARGRTVDPYAFDRHWQRWSHLRAEHTTDVVRAEPDGHEPWRTLLAPRSFALPVLVGAVGVDALTTDAGLQHQEAVAA